MTTHDCEKLVLSTRGNDNKPQFDWLMGRTREADWVHFVSRRQTERRPKKCPEAFLLHFWGVGHLSRASDRSRSDARWNEEAPLHSKWIPQTPYLGSLLSQSMVTRLFP